MKKLVPMEEFTVTYDGEEHKIFRDEMLRDPVLADALTSYENVLEDTVLAEERSKLLLHARRSMMHELRGLLLKHVTSKLSPAQEVILAKPKDDD